MASARPKAGKAKPAKAKPKAAAPARRPARPAKAKGWQPPPPASGAETGGEPAGAPPPPASRSLFARLFRRGPKPPRPNEAKAPKPPKPSKPAKAPKARAAPAEPAEPEGPAGATGREAPAEGSAAARSARHTVVTEEHDADLVALPMEPPRVLLRWRRADGRDGAVERSAQALAAALRAAGLDLEESRPSPRWARLPRPSRRIVHAARPADNPAWASAEVVAVPDVVPLARPDLDGLSRRGARKARRQVRRALRRGLVVAPSEHAREEILRAFPAADASRVHVIRPGLDPAAFQPNDGAPPPWLRPFFRIGFLNVACVLGGEGRDRMDLLAEAVAACPFANLVHVGPGPGSGPGPGEPAKGRAAAWEKAQPALRHLRKEGRYHPLGPLDDARLRDVLARADLVVQPSAAEGPDLPALAALACGAPVLASDIPAHREVLGSTVRYFRLDPAALTDELEMAWDGAVPATSHYPAREDRLAHAAQFTWAKAAQQHLALYARIEKRSPFGRLRLR